MAKKQFRYGTALKAKIVEAVKGARNAGKKAAEVFEAAKDAGYRGGPEALKKMIYTDKAFAGMSKRRRRSRKSARPAEAAATSNGAAKRGRPRKTASSVGGLSEIDSIIQREVANRINAAIGAAVKALEGARM